MEDGEELDEDEFGAPVDWEPPAPAGVIVYTTAEVKVLTTRPAPSVRPVVKEVDRITEAFAGAELFPAGALVGAGPPELEFELFPPEDGGGELWELLPPPPLVGVGVFWGKSAVKDWGTTGPG